MSQIHIKTYNPQYKKDFIRLNKEWITTFFKLEESDIKALENVEEYIINKGGQIFFAVLDSCETVGCCALIAHPEQGNYELAKMAVTPSAQGLGAGRKLGEAAISYAQARGIKQIFLEGNTKMEASISLYKKLGFEETPIKNAAYERCDIMMIINL